ncbi:MAG: cytochrome c-type biogenesis protein [Pseudomonadota bacterium]
MKTLAAFLFLVTQVTGALEDPKAEARAQDLMREIRCVACENEPISQSTSDIAADMRARVREMVSEGASDREVRAWFVERYGQFVLFRPETGSLTGMLLWGLPFVLLAGGAVFLFARQSEPPGVEAVAADHENDTGA